MHLFTSAKVEALTKVGYIRLWKVTRRVLRFCIRNWLAQFQNIISSFLVRLRSLFILLLVFCNKVWKFSSRMLESWPVIKIPRMFTWYCQETCLNTKTLAMFSGFWG